MPPSCVVQVKPASRVTDGLIIPCVREMGNWISFVDTGVYFSGSSHFKVPFDAKT